MESLRTRFPHLKSVKLMVEERRIGWEVDPKTWRTHVYRGLDELPKTLRPAFGEACPGTEIEVADLLSQAYGDGAAEARFELPYRESDVRHAETILRTVVVQLLYRKDSRSPQPARPSRVNGIRMPLACDGLWSRVELHAAQEELAHDYRRLSPQVIRLAVQLAKLDVLPRLGRQRLKKAAITIFDPYRRASAN
jgi:hypothetical protein